MFTVVMDVYICTYIHSPCMLLFLHGYFVFSYLNLSCWAKALWGQNWMDWYVTLDIHWDIHMMFCF